MEQEPVYIFIQTDHLAKVLTFIRHLDMTGSDFISYLYLSWYGGWNLRSPKKDHPEKSHLGCSHDGIAGLVQSLH